MSETTEPPPESDKPPRYQNICGTDDCGHDHAVDGVKPRNGLFNKLVPPSDEANTTPPASGANSPPLPEAYAPTAAPNPSEPPHAPNCNHDHAPSSASGGGAHYHGDTPCSHSHAPSGGAHEPHLPKGKSNAGWWATGIVAAVGVGAYLINEYGKRPEKKKENAGDPADWERRIAAEKSERLRS